MRGSTKSTPNFAALQVHEGEGCGMIHAMKLETLTDDFSVPCRNQTQVSQHGSAQYYLLRCFNLSSSTSIEARSAALAQYTEDQNIARIAAGDELGQPEGESRLHGGNGGAQLQLRRAW